MQIDATDFSLCDVSEACRELGGNKKTPSLVLYFIFFKVTLFFFTNCVLKYTVVESRFFVTSQRADS